MVSKGGLSFHFKASSTADAFGILEDIGGGFFQLADDSGRIVSLGYVFFPKPSCIGDLIIVMDQMFKGLGKSLIEKLSCVKARVYEVNEDAWGRLGEAGVSALRASSDEDIIGILEDMAGGERIVVFFTGDKKLASALKERSPLIEAQYIPPGKHETGEGIVEEMAMRIMARMGLYCGGSQSK